MKQRKLIYIGLYIVIMAAAVSSCAVADWWIFARLFKHTSPVVAQNILVVDVPYKINENTSIFRTRVTALLNDIAKKRESSPQIVVLDISWRADTLGISGLEQAIRRLHDANVAVYAGVDPTREQEKSGQLDPEYMASHAQHLYDLLDGKGHTAFDHLFGVAKYDPKLELPGKKGVEQLQALPVLIATNHFNRPLTASDEPIVLNFGDLKELRRRSYTFRQESGDESIFTQYRPGGGGAPSGTEPDFKGKLVVVGSLDRDKTDLQDLSGPEILAFAISDLILPSESNPLPKVLANPMLLIALVTGFSLFAVFLFMRLYRKWPRFRSKLWLLSLFCVFACLLLLLLWVMAMLTLKYVYPQVTLVGFSIVVSTGLFWFYKNREKEIGIITPPSDESERGKEEMPEYDLFISYARTPENLAWVKANVYEPLLMIRKADGSKLSVFFDQRSIEPGEDFYTKLALAISGSRFFLPVYTADYFTRRFCAFEMKRAALRHVELGDFIIGIAREDMVIPKQYDHIHYLDVRTDDRFMERVAERIRKRDSL